MNYIQNKLNQITKKIFVYENIYKNFNYSFVANIINSFFRLIQVYFFTNFFSEQDYGLWIIVFSFISFFSIMDFGIGSYLSNHLIKVNLKKNRDEFIKFIGLGKLIILTSIIFFFIIILISLFSFDIKNLFNLEEDQVNQFLIISIILLLGQCVNSYQSLFFAILRAIEKMHKALEIHLWVLLIQIGMFILMSIFGNIILISLSLSLPYFVGYFLYRTKILKYFKEKDLKILRSLDIKNLTGLFGGSFSFLLITISHNLLNFIPIFVLKKNYNDTLLIDFFVYRSFFFISIQFCNIFINSFSPKINYTYNFDKRNFEILTNKLLYLQIFNYIGFIFISFLFGEFIFDTLIGDNVKFQKILFILFSSGLIIRLSWWYFINILQALNFVKYTSLLYFLINLLIFIILLYFLPQLDFIYSLKIIFGLEILFLFAFIFLYKIHLNKINFSLYLIFVFNIFVLFLLFFL